MFLIIQQCEDSRNEKEHDRVEHDCVTPVVPIRNAIFNDEFTSEAYSRVPEGYAREIEQKLVARQC